MFVKFVVIAVAVSQIRVAAAAADPRTDRVPLKVRVTPEKPYAGQSVRVEVTAEPRTKGNGPIKIVPPVVEGADLLAGSAGGTNGGASDHRDGSSRIGASYLLVPWSAGELKLRAFRAVDERGEPAGSSPITTIAVRSIPTTGRPRGFLGGVGRIDVASSLSSVKVRTGETTVLSLTLTGEGALGSRTAPSLGLPAAGGDAGAGTGAGVLDIRLIGSELTADPPRRVYRFELRPLRSGTVAIPPVLVATFDPSARGFSVHAGRRLSLEVEPAPRFNPKAIDAALRGPPEDAHRVWGAAIAALGALAFAGAAFCAMRAKRRHKTYRHVINQINDVIAHPRSAAESARLVQDGLRGVLESLGAKPPGAPTPEEIERGFSSLGADEGLCTAARRLAEQCDRIRFGQAANERAGEELRRLARAWLEQLQVGGPVSASRSRSASSPS